MVCAINAVWRCFRSIVHCGDALFPSFEPVKQLFISSHTTVSVFCLLPQLPLHQIRL